MGKDIAFMVRHYPLAYRQAYTLTFITGLLVMQALEYLEYLGDKLIIETYTIV